MYLRGKYETKYQKKQESKSRISYISCALFKQEGAPKKKKPSTISYNTFEIITCQEEKHISIFNNRI